MHYPLSEITLLGKFWIDIIYIFVLSYFSNSNIHRLTLLRFFTSTLYYIVQICTVLHNPILKCIALLQNRKFFHTAASPCIRYNFSLSNCNPLSWYWTLILYLGGAFRLIIYGEYRHQKVVKLSQDPGGYTN